MRPPLVSPARTLRHAPSATPYVHPMPSRAEGAARSTGAMGIGIGTLVFLLIAAAGIWLVPGLSTFPVTRLAALELTVFGLVVGAYGTMVGAGGGFLIVPMLLLAYRLPAPQAA